MTNHSVNNKIKSLAHRSWLVFSQKSSHLLQELSDDPKGGFFWWLKTHKQKLAFDESMEELRQEVRKPEFQLDKVTLIFSKFILKDDDAGQVQWYQDAHNKLVNCQQILEQASTLKPSMVKPALTELRFISEADKFHDSFNLQSLQRRVRDMYEAITERLDALLEDTKNKNQQHRQELEVRKKEAEVQHAAKLAQQQEYQLQEEQAALKKVETERDLIDHQRDADEEAWRREEADRQLKIQESQQQHQLDMQRSFKELQLEDTEELPRMKVSVGKDGIIDVSAEQHAKALLRQIDNGAIGDNAEVKEQLQTLAKAIDSL